MLRNTLQWPSIVERWPIEIPANMTADRWYFYFVKKDGGPNPGTDWLTMGRVLRDTAQRADRASHVKPTSKMGILNVTDTRSPPRWNVAYSAKLAEVNSPSWQMSNKDAVPVLKYLADILSGYGHNLRSCRVTVFRLVEGARRFPMWPGKPYGKRQAFGGFEIQFHKVDIPRGGSSGSLPSGGGSSHGGAGVTF